MGHDEEATEDTAPRPPRGLPLQKGEEVILVATPSRAANFYKYIYTLGLYGFWRKRETAVVTNRRLLMGKGIFNREEYSIAISDVDSARFTRRGFNSYAQVRVGGRSRRRTEAIGPMSASNARRFVGEILHQRG
jgi:Bacterial PH domain